MVSVHSVAQSVWPIQCVVYFNDNCECCKNCLHSWNKDNLLQNRRSSRCTGWRKYLKRKDIIRGIRWHWRMFSKELSHHPSLWFLQMLLELILMMSDFAWALSADQQVFSLNKVSSCLFLLFFFPTEHNAFCHFEAKSKFS